MMERVTAASLLLDAHQMEEIIGADAVARVICAVEATEAEKVRWGEHLTGALLVAYWSSLAIELSSQLAVTRRALALTTMSREIA